MQIFVSRQSNGTHLDGIFVPIVVRPQVSRPINTSLRRLHPEQSVRGNRPTEQLKTIVVSLTAAASALATYLLILLPRFRYQSRYVYTLAHGIKAVTRQRIALGRLIPLIAVISLAVMVNGLGADPAGGGQIVVTVPLSVRL